MGGTGFKALALHLDIIILSVMIPTNNTAGMHVVHDKKFDSLIYSNRIVISVTRCCIHACLHV